MLVATRAYVAVSGRWVELRERGRERGLTTTEVAVLTFILVGLAILVGAFIVNYTNSTLEEIENLEKPVVPSG